MKYRKYFSLPHNIKNDDDDDDTDNDNDDDDDNNSFYVWGWQTCDSHRECPGFCRSVKQFFLNEPVVKCFSICLYRRLTKEGQDSKGLRGEMGINL